MRTEDLKHTLRNHIVSVRFQKVDGTIRIMRCTLNGEYIPQSVKEDKENTVARKVNENVLPVWDLDKEAWRSFRLDSVLGYAAETEGDYEQQVVS